MTNGRLGENPASTAATARRGLRQPRPSADSSEKDGGGVRTPRGSALHLQASRLHRFADAGSASTAMSLLQLPGLAADLGIGEAGGGQEGLDSTAGSGPRSRAGSSRLAAAPARMSALPSGKKSTLRQEPRVLPGRGRRCSGTARSARSPRAGDPAAARVAGCRKSMPIALPPRGIYREGGGRGRRAGPRFTVLQSTWSAVVRRPFERCGPTDREARRSSASSPWSP